MVWDAKAGVGDLIPAQFCIHILTSYGYLMFVR